MLTGNGGFGNKPRALKCHICGREYGTASLQIHLKTCKSVNSASISLAEKEGYSYQERPNSNAIGKRPVEKLSGTQTSKGGQNQYSSSSYRNNNSYATLKSTQSKSQGISSQGVGSKNHNFGGKGGYGQMEGAYESVQLVGCNLCKRKFAIDRIERHKQACIRSQKGEAKHAKKVALAERKQKENERFIAKESKYKKNNWRQQHKEFVENLRYNRRLKAIENRGGDVRAIGPPPKMTAIQTDLIPCPYCYRKFNPQSAEKHINICKNVINKPKPVPTKPNQTSQRSSQQPGFGATSLKTLPSNSSINKMGGVASHGNYVDDDYGRFSYGSAKSTPGKSQAKQVDYADVRSQLAKSIHKGGGFSSQYNSSGSKGSLTQHNNAQAMNNTKGGFGVSNSNTYVSLSVAGKTTSQNFNSYSSTNNRAGKTGNRFY